MEEKRTLSIPEKTNFGLEIEVETDFSNLKRLVHHQLPDYQVECDVSINFAPEVITPILQNTKETWKKLTKLSKTIKHVSPTFKRASFQVNLDIEPSFKKENFLSFFAYYEDIIFRFSTGQEETFRESLKTYAKSIRFLLATIERYQIKDTITDYFQNSKKFAIAFKPKQREFGKELLEFRTPNGTGEVELWKNYITCFYYMITYVASKRFDEEKIAYQLQTILENKWYTSNIYEKLILNSYLEPHYEKAVEFAELIFEEEEDKERFLNQYMKTGAKQFQKVG